MAQCPQCQAEMEDKIHILWCPALSSRAQWTLSVQKLSCWMRGQGTALEVQTTILLQLERWVKEEPAQASMEEPFCEDQQQIGWDTMMDGWLIHRWQDHQEKFGNVPNHRNQACGEQLHLYRNYGTCHGICGTIATKNYTHTKIQQ